MYVFYKTRFSEVCTKTSSIENMKYIKQRENEKIDNPYINIK